MKVKKKVEFFMLWIGVMLLISCCTNKEPQTKYVSIDLDNKQQIKNHFVIPEIPNAMLFAGDSIFFKDIDLKERLDRELVVNNFWHSNTILEMKLAHRWMPMITNIIKKEGLPEDLKYIAVIESGLRNVTSHRGAKGFWQIMEPTGKELGLKINREVDERLNVEKSTYAACQYLKDAYDELGSWPLAIASYNRGIAGIKRAMKKQKTDNYFDLYLNTETSRYLFRILATKLIFEAPEHYGFYLGNNSLYPPFETIQISITSDIEDLAAWAKLHQSSYKIVKKLNPWILTNSLKVKKKDDYAIKLPKNNQQLSVLSIND